MNFLYQVQFLLSLIIAAGAFHPDVRWTCNSDSVSIFVRSTDPFEGIIKPRNAKNEECIVRGFGANLAVLKLNFSSKDCGINFYEAEDSHSLTLEVHSHPVLIVDQDKSIDIKCKRQNVTEAVQHDIRGPVFKMILSNKEKKATDFLYYGESGSVEIQASAYGRAFSVGACTALAGTNTTVDLIDHRGCSRHRNLMSNFMGSSNGTGLTANFPSMFRFPGSDNVTLTCQVQFCEGACERPNCQMEEEERTMNLLEKSPSTEMEQFSTVTINFTVKDKRAADVPISLTPPPRIRPLTSETRRSSMVSPTEQTVPSAAASEQQCVRQTDVEILYLICAVLTVCATVGFTLNICLCCIIMRRKSDKKERKSTPKAKDDNNQFWIMDSAKQTPESNDLASKPYYGNQRQSVLYASVKQKPVQTPIPPTLNYCMPHTSSESSSSYGGDIYIGQEARHSNSTFMTPSLTMETDIDSTISNNSHQASSYH